MKAVAHTSERALLRARGSASSFSRASAHATASEPVRVAKRCSGVRPICGECGGARCNPHAQWISEAAAMRDVNLQGLKRIKDLLRIPAKESLDWSRALSRASTANHRWLRKQRTTSAFPRLAAAWRAVHPLCDKEEKGKREGRGGGRGGKGVGSVRSTTDGAAAGLLCSQ